MTPRYHMKYMYFNRIRAKKPLIKHQRKKDNIEPRVLSIPQDLSLRVALPKTLAFQDAKMLSNQIH
jgi:hypothetical protein